MNLSDRALLVQLNVSQWTARKYDKRATQEVADKHGVASGVGRYNKSLLPMNGYLDKIHAKAMQIRLRYYANTLPWGIEGTHILPSANYLSFMTEFRNHKGEWLALVKMFLDNYARLKGDAEEMLGSLYNEDDYPRYAEVEKKFKMDLAVFPVPHNDFRVQIGSEELTRIQQDVEARVKDASAAAMREIWQRLYDQIAKVADRLEDDNSRNDRFVEMQLDNAREMCALLPRLNFADDPALERMRHEIEGKLFSHHVVALTEDTTLRRNTASEVRDILAKMSAFMGGESA